MKNNVLIASALNEHARIYFLDGTVPVEKARVLHDLWPTSCAALGRTICAAAILGLMQKDEEDTITVQINGGGPAGTLLCVANGKGEVKGCIDEAHIYETYPDTHKLAVGKAVGTDGYLSVIKNLHLSRSYDSRVELQSGEIGDDFAYYFAISEQIPAIVSLGVLVDVDDSVKAAGALIIELLPGHTEADIEYLEKLQLEPVSSVIARNDDLHAYLKELFPDHEILAEKEVLYHCDCSKERFREKLLTLPKKDLKDILKEEKIRIRCEFCEKEYEFDRSDFKDVSV